MPKLIDGPSTVESVGNKPKIIREYIGRVNTGADALSVAHMTSPQGWCEPGQRPEFDEYTLVMKGCLRVEFEGGAFDVRAGQAILCEAGECVRYSTEAEGADYVAICRPAFTPESVHRDEEESND